jgi:hypothetical protein
MTLFCFHFPEMGFVNSIRREVFSPVALEQNPIGAASYHGSPRQAVTFWETRSSDEDQPAIDSDIRTLLPKIGDRTDRTSVAGFK